MALVPIRGLLVDVRPAPSTAVSPFDGPLICIPISFLPGIAGAGASISYISLIEEQI